MPTISIGTDDATRAEGSLPYWKQPAHSEQPLPPPALAALALKRAGDPNVFAPPQPEVHLATAVQNEPQQPSSLGQTTKRGGLVTATICTDDTLEGTDDTFCVVRDGPNLNLATVASHMMKLQRLLKNNGVPIAIDAFETIAEVSDLLDQIFYWGLAESRFPERPFSALCECEVIETLTPILENDRPSLVVASLRALTMVLRHPISCKHFAKRNGSFRSVFVALTRFPARSELVADAISVCQSAAPGNIEGFLESDCLSGVIAGMQRHTEHLEIQKRGAVLFANLVDMPRDDPETVPISILFVHIGQIVQFVLAAADQQSTSSEVNDAVVHFFEVATRFPENILKLVSTKRFLETIGDLARRGVGARSTDSVVSTLGVIANIIPGLDMRFKMRMSCVVRDVMIKTTDTLVLMACFAVLRALLVSSRSPPPQLPTPPPVNDGDKELTLTRPKGSAVTTAEPLEVKLAREYEVLKAHMTDEQIPQCILIAMDHFGEDGDELHQLGTEAVREMAMRRFHWQ